MFGDAEIEKHKFYYHINPYFTDDVEIDKKFYLTYFFLVKKILNILLITKIMKI